MTTKGRRRPDFHVSAERRQMIASVRHLTQAKCRPKAGRWMDGSFPWENVHATFGMIRGRVSNLPPGMT
jgi:hypothetical protein